MTEIEIDKIIIGERFRKDFGDITSLANNIMEVGLLHPIVINEKNELIAGYRRIKAYQFWLWKIIPCTIVSVDDARKAEVSENKERKNFTITEIVAIERAIGPEIRADADDRKKAGIPSGKFPEGTHSRDIIAKYVGVSGKTLEKAKVIVEAYEKDPVKYMKIMEAVDSGKTSVSYAYQSINLQQKHAKPSPLPEGLFDVILADPPWKYSFTAVSGNPEEQYPTMSLDEICQLKVPSAKDSILFLWATNPLIREALKVMEAWGYEYLTNLVWIKNGLGIGHYVRGDHELLLIGKKGQMPPPEEGNRPSSVIKADKRGHSRKPDEIYNIIESMYPNRRAYLELFARPETIREGWVYWGDETERQKLEK